MDAAVDEPDFGGRVKMLFGLEHTRGTNTGLGFTLNDSSSDGPTLYQVDNQLNLMSSGLSHYSGNDPAGFFGEGNLGFAVDLGGVMKISEKVEVSASITNLGMIRWKNNLDYKMIDQINADTSTVSTFLDHFFDSTIDELVHRPSGDGVAAYTSRPASQLFIGSRYTFNDQNTLGLLLNARFQEEKTDIGGSLSYIFSPIDWLDLSGSYTVYNDSYFNLGFGAAVNFGPFQMFLATDNVVGMVSPSSTHNAHVSAGINLIFGDNKDPEKKPDDEMEIAMEETLGDTLAVEPEEDVPAHIKNTFFISGQVNEAITNNPVYATYIDVYKISLDG